MSSKSEKEQALFNFIDDNKFLPVQGSKEWLAARSNSIGGSEISTILNLNPYQNITKLIKQKIGLTEFKKSAPLWFGNIFEYILQQYTENIFDTTVYETGSIQYTKSDLIKYSPDGMSIINIDKLKKIISQKDIENIINPKSKFDNNLERNNKELLILFEFKNPYMRVIKQNEIPVYYKPQPELGLEVIDICEASIFIEAVFRFSSFNDIISNNNKYNTRYHFDRVRYTNTPLAFGAYTLYYEKDNTSERLSIILNEIFHYIQNNHVNKYDISNFTDKKIINSIMENIIDFKDIKIKYHNILVNEEIGEDEFVNEEPIVNDDMSYFKKYANKNKITKPKNKDIFNDQILENKENIKKDDKLVYLGYMGFKMFNINIQPVYKTDIINDNILNKIQTVVDIIKQCNDCKNKTEQKNIIDIASKSKVY